MVDLFVGRILLQILNILVNFTHLFDRLSCCVVNYRRECGCKLE